MAFTEQRAETTKNCFEYTSGNELPGQYCSFPNPNFEHLVRSPVGGQFRP